MFGELLGVHEKVFKDLLVLDQLRGRDSTGVLSVKRHTDHQILKVVGGPEELTYDKRYDDLFKGAINALIGHNRWKTKGSVNRRNAHPFETPNLIGVHNGTLNNQWKLDNGNSFDVDSEALFHHMDKNGVKHTMDTADGAYALVWWNKKEQTVNFVRNKDRPLFLAYTKDKKVMFLASEGWMIEGAAERNNVELFDFPMLVATDNVVTIPLAKGTGVMGKPRIFHYERPVPPVVVINRQNWNNNPPQRTPATVVTKPKDEMLGEKGKDVLFEVGKASVTSHGSHYYELHPVVAGYEGHKFIVFDYQKRLANLFENATYITGSVSHDSTVVGMGKVYVIEAKGIEVCESVTASKLLSDIDEEVKKEEKQKEEEKPKMYKQYNGSYLSKKEFEDKFPYCNICMQDIDPDKDNEFTKSGDIICHDCCKDKTIREQVGI